MTDYANSGMRRPDNGATIATGAATARQHANSIQTGTDVTGTGVTKRITFPVPFQAGTVPVVVCNPSTSNPLSLQVSASSPDATGFTVNIGRVSGTTSFTFWYIAVGRGTEVGG